MYNNIRKIRLETGITQQELADIVGVSRQTIHALEKDKYNPSLMLAYNITRKLGKKHIEEVFIFTKDDEL